MSHAELVRRLREFDRTPRTVLEAADAIEALEARLAAADALAKAVERYRDSESIWLFVLDALAAYRASGVMAAEKGEAK